MTVREYRDNTDDAILEAERDTLRVQLKYAEEKTRIAQDLKDVWMNKAIGLNQENVRLKKILEDAPHEELCASGLCQMCDGESDEPIPKDCDGRADTCPYFKAMPCDCWKASALAPAPEVK